MTEAPRPSYGALVTPVSRMRALSRGAAWGAGALILGVMARAAWERLDFTRTGVHSLLVEGALAVVGLAPAAGAVICAARAFLYLLLGLWTKRIGVFADDEYLTLRLGPFGTMEYPVRELDIRYPFELSGDEDSFEAFLPKDVQRATMLPRMLRHGEPKPIQQMILRFAAGTEAEVAARMRPWIERVTGKKDDETP